MNFSRVHKAWKKEIEAIKEFSKQEGLSIEWRNPEYPVYQIAKLSGDGVSLIVYPHTVRKTLNKHARVRDNNSKDVGLARSLMNKMDAFSGFNSTFTHKNSNWEDTEEVIKIIQEKRK